MRGRPESTKNDILLGALSHTSAPSLTVLRPFLKLFPPMIARRAVKYFTGGAISAKTLANDDSRGTGPRRRFMLNGHVVYPADYFLEYLERRGVQELPIINL
jgi:hypothetical protein